ncbi:MAG: DUF357 domain-containing protein [Candidatus Bilamarchaeaceae archaeon]
MNNERERVQTDIKKLIEIIKKFEELGYSKKHAHAYSWAKNYLEDAAHFFEKGDYFTAFGCANYAYGIIDGILITEESVQERKEKNRG